MSMRLVASSDPSAVSRFEARERLLQRAVLTRAVCRELLDKPEAKLCRSSRASVAMDLLMGWIYSQAQCPVLPSPSSGIDAMVVPEDCAELLEEIRDGAVVCEAHMMLDSADIDSDWQSDMSKIEAALKSYWSKHNSPTIK